MRFKITVGAVAMGCALVLGGCASTGNNDAGTNAETSQAPVTSATVLADAMKATEAAGSSRISGNLTAGAGGADMTAQISGVQTFNPMAADLTLKVGDTGSIRQIFVDGKAYVQMPELKDQWVSVDVAAMGGSLPLMGGADLSGLPEATSDGTGTVEGTPVTFYTTTLDLNKALELSGGSADGLADTLAPDAGSAKLRFAVDDSGRMVQWAMDTTTNLKDGSSQTTKMDLRYYDFGVATDIKAPPADQVVDGSSLGLPGATE